MPILFWWGRSERLLPGSHLAWWKEHLPAHAVFERPEGVGHCPQLDAPARLADRIASFVATPAVARPARAPRAAATYAQPAR
jgi:pimeloyl-ACP methyl ester carboxylesterase